MKFAGVVSEDWSWLSLDESLDLSNIAPRFHLGRDMVVPFQNGSRDNITCVMYMSEKWHLSTRHRPSKVSLGIHLLRQCWSARQAVITEHQPHKRSMLEWNVQTIFLFKNSQELLSGFLKSAYFLFSEKGMTILKSAYFEDWWSGFGKKFKQTYQSELGSSTDCWMFAPSFGESLAE